MTAENETSEPEIRSLEEIEEEYRTGSEILLRQISMREKMLRLLRVAKPEKIERLRSTISQLEKAIEVSEQCLETLAKLRDARIKLDEELNELVYMMEVMKPELLKYIAEHYPEKLEEIEELFIDAEDYNNTSN